MATIFQRLNRTFGRGVTDATSMQFTNASDKYADLKPNDVIYTTDNEQDYQQKLLQLRQQRLLSRQWKRAQYETQNNALANLSQVQMMYREADLMDAFPEVGSAIDIYMEGFKKTDYKEAYEELVAGTSKDKVAALAEVGYMPDVEMLEKSRVPWAYYMTWSKEFCIGEQYNSVEHLKSMYASDYSIVK